MSQETKEENKRLFINDINVTGFLQRVNVNKGPKGLVNVKFVIRKSESRPEKTASLALGGRERTYKLGLKPAQNDYYLQCSSWLNTKTDKALLNFFKNQEEIINSNKEKKEKAEMDGIKNSRSDYQQTALINVKGHLETLPEKFAKNEKADLGEGEMDVYTEMQKSYIKTTPEGITFCDQIYKRDVNDELVLKDGRKQYADGIESNNAHIKGNVSHVKNLGTDEKGQPKGWEINVMYNRSRPMSDEEAALVDKEKDFAEQNWKEYALEDGTKFQVRRSENHNVTKEHPEKYIYLVSEATAIKMNIPGRLTKSDKNGMNELVAMLESGEIQAKSGMLEVEGRIHDRKITPRAAIVDDKVLTKEFRTMEIDINKFDSFTPKLSQDEKEARKASEEMEERPAKKAGRRM